MGSVRLYVDDERPCPAGWTLARTIDEAKLWLILGVQAASLDHDMGPGSYACPACQGQHPANCDEHQTGHDLVRWIVETGHWPKEKPTVHSANPVGAKRMRDLIEQEWPRRKGAHGG